MMIELRQLTQAPAATGGKPRHQLRRHHAVAPADKMRRRRQHHRGLRCRIQRSAQWRRLVPCRPFCHVQRSSHRHQLHDIVTPRRQKCGQHTPAGMTEQAQAPGAVRQLEPVERSHVGRNHLRSKAQLGPVAGRTAGKFKGIEILARTPEVSHRRRRIDRRQGEGDGLQGRRVAGRMVGRRPRGAISSIYTLRIPSRRAGSRRCSDNRRKRPTSR